MKYKKNVVRGPKEKKQIGQSSFRQGCRFRLRIPWTLMSCLFAPWRGGGRSRIGAHELNCNAGIEDLF